VEVGGGGVAGCHLGRIFDVNSPKLCHIIFDILYEIQKDSHDVEKSGT
jgi:hypothetical protein